MPDDPTFDKTLVVMTKGSRERAVPQYAVEFREKTGWKVVKPGPAAKVKE